MWRPEVTTWTLQTASFETLTPEAYKCVAFVSGTIRKMTYSTSKQDTTATP
jgi:hypothetical protein